MNTNYCSWVLTTPNGTSGYKVTGAKELSAPTTFKGLDGEPCGVTGGMYKWNPIPSTPRILSTSVDAKSENGKLNVIIKAEARPIE